MTESSSASGSSGGKPYHILVVDDEPHIGRIIKMKLEQGPFEATLVEDGEQALRRIREDTAIALVVLDLMMPVVSGLDVLEQMRADQRTKNLPCIVLTAAGEEEMHRKAMALGATQFVTKPFSPKKLYNLIAQLVGETPAHALGPS